MTVTSRAPDLQDEPVGSAILARAATVVAPAFEAAIGRLSPGLRAPVQHHVDGGGKRVRAGLVLVSAVAAGGWEEPGIVGAVAIELVHNFSLLHDDIIDEDRDRRHRPTVWAQFGIGQAIVAGDALAALATQVLLDAPTPERVRAASSLASATQAMIAGQAEDMAFETRSSVTVDECIAMAVGKTGALLSCASSLGALLVGAPDDAVTALSGFGRHVGIAFQAVDDVLGIWGDPAHTGKPAGNDLVQHKKTLPVAVALANAGPRRAELEERLAGIDSPDDINRAAELIDACGGRATVVAMADSHLDQAIALLDQADLVATGRDQLEAIARFVTARDR
jgi:geranylgeranyl diphosphate synthase, type I